MLRLVVPMLVLALAACSTGNPAPSPDADASVTASSESVSPTETPPAADDRPEYVSSVQPIAQPLRERMRFSHRPDCPVHLSNLRYLRMSYLGFDGEVHLGEMVVHKDYANEVTGVFEKLYDANWPIRRMRLVDDYRGDDDRSMAANNTSAYNCRRVAGSDDWSRHAYGAAIDINPVQNPYVQADLIAPPAGRRFASVDRAADADVPAGAIQRGDIVIETFGQIGWEWGGDWHSAKDYQHFSASGD